MLSIGSRSVRLSRVLSADGKSSRTKDAMCDCTFLCLSCQKSNQPQFILLAFGRSSSVPTCLTD